MVFVYQEVETTRRTTYPVTPSNRAMNKDHETSSTNQWVTLLGQAIVAGVTAAVVHSVIASSSTTRKETLTRRQLFFQRGQETWHRFKRQWVDSMRVGWYQYIVTPFQQSHGEWSWCIEPMWKALAGGGGVLWLLTFCFMTEHDRHRSSHWVAPTAAGMIVLGYFGLMVPHNDEKRRPATRRSSPTPIDPQARRRISESSTTTKRYLELLVHNVSHTDLVLSIQDDSAQDLEIVGTDDAHNSDDDDPYCLCRPRFSCFDLYSRKVLQALQQDTDEEASIVWAPRYQRALDSPRFRIMEQPSQYPLAAIGFGLPCAVPVDNLHDLRIRGRDQPKCGVFAPESDISPDTGTKHGPWTISHVFFPLLATLLPRWERQIADKAYHAPVHRVLLLVTGVGTPRNWTHSVTGNSTQALADLMRLFLQRIDPNLQVIQLHSETNIFRYDENLVFVEREFKPTLEAYRDAHARGLSYPNQDDLQQLTSHSDLTRLSAPQHHNAQHPFNVDWFKSMAVTLSFADGSPARTHAIQACLRPYRPTYFHFWQLKTFWHESKLVDGDIEVHSFEAMETIPPTDANRLVDPWICAVVQEMKAFLAEMTQTLLGDAHDFDRFWLRKTHKPVLAVLLVQTPEMKEPALYRGTNMEVSMPTGSLCAERNVIGSALAQNPSLKRQDLKLIAVLAVPLVEEASSLRRVPSTSTVASGDRKLSSGSENESRPISRRHSMGSEPDEWILPASGPESSLEGETFALMEETEQGTPVKRIPLFSKATARKQSSKRTVVVHSCQDLNPLKPCGACNEWLKKIAESNPYFRIITFTDADCNGIYVTPCQE